MSGASSAVGSFLGSNGPGIASALGTGAQLFGANTSATGAKAAGTAAGESDLFNAAIANANAGIALRNANFTAGAGEAKAGISETQTEARVGATKANQGASGVEVNSGSNVQVRASEAEVGMLDALTIKSNAAKQAYGYQVEAVGETAKAKMLTAQAPLDVAAGNNKAQGTLLAGVGEAGKAYAEMKSKTGLNSGDLQSGGGINWNTTGDLGPINWDTPA